MRRYSCRKAALSVDLLLVLYVMQNLPDPATRYAECPVTSLPAKRLFRKSLLVDEPGTGPLNGIHEFGHGLRPTVPPENVDMVFRTADGQRYATGGVDLRSDKFV